MTTCPFDTGRPVKTFIDFGGGLWLKDTTTDRVKPVADPYESGDCHAQDPKPIENLKELRGGYDELS